MKPYPIMVSFLVTFLVVCVALAATPPKASSPRAVSPCYDRYVDNTPTTTGCTTITKTQPTDVYFKDGHVAHISQGPNTGGCGQDTYINACPNCGLWYVQEKACWPRFLSPCPSNDQLGGSSCWTGRWDRTVVNQSANQTTEICCGGSQKPVTTCADTTSDTYSVEHTCPC